MISPTPSANIAGGRSDIGGYEVLRTLVPEQSWLAAAAGGRKVVLKTLDDDCLWKGQLHPSIKDRLARVRELAHVGVANLYGVERDAGLTYLVWEYVEGETLAEYAGSPRCEKRECRRLARELVLAVEMLHARGIVHGAIKASNVILDRDGRVVLTHVSPLLYTDPAEDVAALADTLRDLAPDDEALKQVLAEAGEGEISLRRLATRMGALVESREAEGAVGEADRQEGKAIRRRALLGAYAAGVLAVLLFAGLKVYADRRSPKPPVPPQPPPAAMQPVAHP
jgi:tRNA A-37 threonylcarbamoyl transferase component Bud32